jgi:hypothetical protein
MKAKKASKKGGSAKSRRGIHNHDRGAKGGGKGGGMGGGMGGGYRR